MTTDDEIAEKIAALAADEERLVRQLGERIGYGRIIQLCERLWSEVLGSDSPALYATKRLARYDEREPDLTALLDALDETQFAWDPLALPALSAKLRGFKIDAP